MSERMLRRAQAISRKATLFIFVVCATAFIWWFSGVTGVPRWLRLVVVLEFWIVEMIRVFYPSVHRRIPWAAR